MLAATLACVVRKGVGEAGLAFLDALIEAPETSGWSEALLAWDEVSTGPLSLAVLRFLSAAFSIVSMMVLGMYVGRGLSGIPA